MLDYRDKLIAELSSKDLVLLDLVQHNVTEVCKDPVAVFDAMDTVNVGEFAQVEEYCSVLLQLFVALHGIQPLDAGMLICKTCPDLSPGRPDELFFLVDDVLEKHHEH